MSAADITCSIEAAMRERYAPPEWALLFNVGNGTGSRLRGWADAVAMNMFPSRGLAIHGFEFKASRGDWRKELADPAKAENVARFCDYWWLVAEDRIVREGELPMSWGYIVHANGKLTIKQAAAKLEAQPVTRAFVAAMLRRISEADKAVIDQIVTKQVQEARKQDKADLDRRIATSTREHRELLERLAQIKVSTGINLDSWAPSDQVAGAIRFALAAGIGRGCDSMSHAITRIESLAKQLRDAATQGGFIKEQET